MIKRWMKYPPTSPTYSFRGKTFCLNNLFAIILQFSGCFFSPPYLSWILNHPNPCKLPATAGGLCHEYPRGGTPKTAEFSSWRPWLDIDIDILVFFLDVVMKIIPFERETHLHRNYFWIPCKFSWQGVMCRFHIWCRHYHPARATSLEVKERREKFSWHLGPASSLFCNSLKFLKTPAFYAIFRRVWLRIR